MPPNKIIPRGPTPLQSLCPLALFPPLLVALGFIHFRPLFVFLLFSIFFHTILMSFSWIFAIVPNYIIPDSQNGEIDLQNGAFCHAFYFPSCAVWLLRNGGKGGEKKREGGILYIRFNPNQWRILILHFFPRRFSEFNRIVIPLFSLTFFLAICV